ncbi:hypothetical protein I4U23_011487 [Adineta vaga]|nr:hypothetical protein I4U23_011487 [Adineta vaga]
MEHGNVETFDKVNDSPDQYESKIKSNAEDKIKNNSVTRSSNDNVSFTVAPKPATVVPSVTTPRDRQDPSFMYARLLRELLVSMDVSDDNIRKDLIIECCKRFANDSLELSYIDELDVEYKPERAVWWYTRPTFMSKMLNSALLTQDINVLYKMRFFVKDLHLELVKLHSQFIQTLKSTSITVYRGISLQEDGFRQIEQNCGGLISFNTFLSTTIERKVALSFATQKMGSQGIRSVLFEMTIDVNKCQSPFADIQQYSEVPGEKEILFSMGTIFRIQQVDRLPSGIWKVQLLLNGDEDLRLNQLTEYMRAELQGPNPLFTLGGLMKTLCQYDKAEHFYQMLMTKITTFSNNPKDQAQLYSDLGTIYMDKRLYSKAAEYFQQSIEYDSNSAECYENLGLVCQELGQHQQALNHLHHAIELNQNGSVSNKKIADQFSNLGTVYYKQKNFERAQHYYEQALKLRLECLPETHPDIAQSYSNIAAVIYAQKDYVSAFSYFNKALVIKSDSLPSDHPSLAITLNNIACTFINQKLYEKALPFATRAAEISTKSLTKEHPQSQEFSDNLRLIQQQLNKPDDN